MKTNWELSDAVEISLPNDDVFLQIKETLTRIGIVSYATKTLYQTAHILHKQGRYYIIHFKALFALDGKVAIFDKRDFDRQCHIAKLLEDWGLCSIVNRDNMKNIEPPTNLKILKYSDKREWSLVSKYNIGV